MKTKGLVLKWCLLLWVSCFSILNCVASRRITPELVGCPPHATKPQPLQNQWSVVSINVWKLAQVHRVPAVLNTLKTLGQHLHRTNVKRYPDVIFFQELKGPTHGKKSIFTALKRSFQKNNYWFGFGVCAPTTLAGKPPPTLADGALGIAIRRARFTQLPKSPKLLYQKLVTGIDHGRCFISVNIPLKAGQSMLLTNTHLTPSAGRGLLGLRQVKGLLKKLKAQAKEQKSDHIILGGDFNFTNHDKHYAYLTNAKHSPLRDAYCANRGYTHCEGRLDFVFLTKRLALLRPLNRRIALRAVLLPCRSRSCKAMPSCAQSRMPRRCRDTQRATMDCPVSDHLPEGGIFQYK